MRSKKGNSGGLIAGVLAVILLAIIMCTTVTPSIPSDADDATIVGGELMLLNTNPPELKVLEDTLAYNWTAEHTGVEVSGVPLTESTRIADKFTIENSKFGNNENLLHKFVMRNSTVSADLTFNVLDSNRGTLKVMFNDKKVFGRKVSAGETIEVNLLDPKPGEENKIAISTNSPFWPWQVYYFDLEGVYLDESIFGEDKAETNITIPLSRDEAIGLSSAKITADVEMLEGVENKKVIISLNGETVYSNIPGAVHGTIETSLPARSFIAGDNDLTFRTELNGGYLIDFTLELEVLNLTQESYEVYKIQVGDNAWPQIEKGQKDEGYECELALQRSSGSDAVTVWLNDRRQSLAFDANNEISQNVCGFLDEGLNTIMLIADTEGSSGQDFIDVEKLSLAIREK